MTYFGRQISTSLGCQIRKFLGRQMRTSTRWSNRMFTGRPWMYQYMENTIN